MKKQILIFSLIFLFFGCNLETSQKQQEDNKKDIQTELIQDILEEFENQDNINDLDHIDTINKDGKSFKNADVDINPDETENLDKSKEELSQELDNLLNEILTDIELYD